MSTAARQIEVSRGALWFGLLGGAFAWTVHLLFAYAASEFGCVGRGGEHSHGGITMVAWLVLALTVATALASGAATAVAYRSHRRLRPSEGEQDAAKAAERYTARAGLLTSGTFTFVILFESIPILYYLHGC